MKEETKPSVLIIKDRGKGKSTQLVYTSATTQYPIIVSTKAQIMYLLNLANELDFIIPTPMTIEDYKANRQMHGSNILIDEGYDLIGKALDAYMGSHVVAVTLSDKVKEMNDIREGI